MVIVMKKIRELLPYLPSSISKIIVHVGSNDTVRCESGFSFGSLKQCGKSIFISGPIPTVGCRDERFSRIISLNNWLHTCREHGVGFIDNILTCSGTKIFF